MNAEFQSADGTKSLVTRHVKTGRRARSQVVPQAVNAQTQPLLWPLFIALAIQVMLAHYVKLTLTSAFLSHVKILQHALIPRAPVCPSTSFGAAARLGSSETGVILT